VQCLHEKQHLSNVNNPKVFLYYMLCTRTFAPALFNIKVKCKRIRHVLKWKSKSFLAFNEHHFTVEVRKYVQ